MKLLDYLGLQTLVTKIKTAVQGGTWLNVKNGDGEGSVVLGKEMTAETTATLASDDDTAEAYGAHGKYSVAGSLCQAYGNFSNAEGASITGSADDTSTDDFNAGVFAHSEGFYTKAMGCASHTEGMSTIASGAGSHAEGSGTKATGQYSHAEGDNTEATGESSHVQGQYNYADANFTDMVGIGTGESARKNAEVTYYNTNDTTDAKNGNKYLLGIGGYEGQGVDDAESVQEVISTMQTNIKNTTSSVVRMNTSLTSAQSSITSMKSDISKLQSASGGKTTFFDTDVLLTISSSSGTYYLSPDAYGGRQTTIVFVRNAQEEVYLDKWMSENASKFQNGDIVRFIEIIGRGTHIIYPTSYSNSNTRYIDNCIGYSGGLSIYMHTNGSDDSITVLTFMYYNGKFYHVSRQLGYN